MSAAAGVEPWDREVAWYKASFIYLRLNCKARSDIEKVAEVAHDLIKALVSQAQC